MDFLLISSPDIAESTAAIRKRLMTAALMSPIDGPLGFFELGGLFVAANGHQSNDTTTLCYDGFGIGVRTAFSSGCAATLPISTANTYLDACLDPVNKSDLRGVFTLMRFNPHTKAFTVAADPLSLYPVFICGLSETLIVSNNCYLIQQAVNAMGLTLTRSSKAAATYCARGVGLGNRTGYREIALLPPEQLVTGIGPNWRLVSAAKLPELDVVSYDELLNLAAERLRSSIRAVVKAGRDQIIQFSMDGGLHSRLIMATAMAEGVPSLKLSLSTDRLGDQEIVRHLASKCGAEVALDPQEEVTATTAVGVARKTTFRAQGLQCFPQTFPKISREKRIFRIQTAEQLGRTKHLSSGVPKGLFWSNPLTAMTKISSNDPVYSACLAAYSGGFTNRRRKIAAKWAYQICSLGRSTQSIYQKPFLRAITNTVIDEMTASSSAVEQMGADYVYADQHRRERGLQLRQENLACGVFDPFADPFFHNIFKKLTILGKTEAEFLVNLIENLAGSEILKIPFAVDVLNGDAGDALVKTLKVNKKKLIRASVNFLASEVGGLTVNIGPEETNVTDPYSATAKQILPELSALVAALPVGHECWQYFRREKLLAALKDETVFLKNQAGAILILQLLQTFIWTALAEDKTGVETLA